VLLARVFVGFAFLIAILLFSTQLQVAWKCSFLDDQIVRQLGPAESESKEIGLKSSKGKPNEGSW
jgi:hypothetical protein